MANTLNAAQRAKLFETVPTDVWYEAEKLWTKHYPRAGKLLPYITDVRHTPGSRDWYILPVNPEDGTPGMAIKVHSTV